MMYFYSKIILAATILLASTGSFAQQSGTGFITLGGDPKPDRTIIQYQAFCGINSIELKLQSQKSKSTSIIDISINGQSKVNSPEYKEFKEFMADLVDPNITSVRCPSKAISVVVAGRKSAGDETAFRLTFPLN